MKLVNCYLSLFFFGLILSSCIHNRGMGQVPKADMKFPVNKNVVEIPFTRYRGWIIIQVSVNNAKSTAFIFRILVHLLPFLQIRILKQS